MNCPVCDKPMVVFEVREVEVDHCVQCRGTWLDAGELELLLDGAENARGLLASMTSDAASDEAPRPCPICERKMQKVTLVCGDAEPVTLDKCSRNDGLWFDEGELSDIVNMSEFPCSNPVYELLDDVFGRKEQDKT